MRTILLLLTATLIVGCSSTYEQVHVTSPTAQFETGKSILIALPANGSYETINYSESGRMTAIAVSNAFSKYSGDISIVDECQNLECLQSKAAAEGYFVVPEILHWEDRNTEWSGRKDVIEIRLEVIDAVSGITLAATVISGKSKWATFGGDHPQDLLPGPLQAYVDSLY